MLSLAAVAVMYGTAPFVSYREFTSDAYTDVNSRANTYTGKHLQHSLVGKRRKVYKKAVSAKQCIQTAESLALHSKGGVTVVHELPSLVSWISNACAGASHLISNEATFLGPPNSMISSWFALPVAPDAQYLHPL